MPLTLLYTIVETESITVFNLIDDGIVTVTYETICAEGGELSF